VNAYEPSKDIIDYAATKGAIMIFTKGLAKQLAPQGVLVNAVAPGPVWTPLQPSGGQQPDKLSEFGADTPMGRPAQPAELAPIYVLLASDESSYSTGQVYGAVGGRGGSAVTVSGRGPTAAAAVRSRLGRPGDKVGPKVEPA